MSRFTQSQNELRPFWMRLQVPIWSCRKYSNKQNDDLSIKLIPCSLTSVRARGTEDYTKSELRFPALSEARRKAVARVEFEDSIYR